MSWARPPGQGLRDVRDAYEAARQGAARAVAGLHALGQYAREHGRESVVEIEALAARASALQRDVEALRGEVEALTPLVVEREKEERRIAHEAREADYLAMLLRTQSEANGKKDGGWR